VVGVIGWIGAAMILGSTLVYQMAVRRRQPASEKS